MGTTENTESTEGTEGICAAITAAYGARYHLVRNRNTAPNTGQFAGDRSAHTPQLIAGSRTVVRGVVFA